MQRSIRQRIHIVHGDITQVDTDIIVTAANEALCGGGGVDGAVHRGAGPELVQASMALAPCPPGQARITDAFRLDAQYVIHAVGPIFQDLKEDAIILASAYESSLQLAAEREVDSIAFPCISTGVYGFPQKEACEIAFETVVRWLETNGRPPRVIFCCFSEEDKERYETQLSCLR